MLRRYLLFAIVLLGSVSASSQADTVVFKPHNPTRATLYSTFLPGLGQIYNKQVWKVPIIYGAGAVVTYFAVTNYNGRMKFRNEYLARVNCGQTNSDLARFTNEGVYRTYQSYEQAFELSLIIGGVVYLFNIIDALVYAHLFSFDISDNLSANISPVIISSPANQSTQATFGLLINFSFK
jgi:hypothetical protein